MKLFKVAFIAVTIIAIGFGLTTAKTKEDTRPTVRVVDSTGTERTIEAVPFEPFRNKFIEPKFSIEKGPCIDSCQEVRGRCYQGRYGCYQPPKYGLVF